jgi:uncharacterized protein (DUF885 family)
MQAAAESTGAALNAALRMIDDAWREVQRSPFVQLRLGVLPDRLPDVSLAEAERRSEVGRSLLKRLDRIDLSVFPHDLALTLRLVRFRAHTWSREADWYWIVVDPRSIGSFGAFLPTAYCGAYLLNFIHNQLASLTFQSSSDIDRYLALVADYARLIDQFTERTAGQAKRGIYMPRVQIQQARTLLAAFRSGVRAVLRVAPQRLAIVPVGNFGRELDSRIVTRIEPAFDRAIENLSDTYFAKAPERVGIGQYPGGVDVYAELVKHYTTLDLTPEQVHTKGLERMSEIEASMSSVRAELGFKGDGLAFLAHLNRQPYWRAESVEDVTAVFQRYIDRLDPHLVDFFPTVPKAPYGVSPLPEAVQGSMTFGYYDPPRKDRADGRYLFNARNLTRQALFHIGALTYHELMPGHHLHLATQQENEGLHPFRAHSFVTAYMEGWAEYAATLAGEIGMYELPEERYGRSVMDAFLTCRLVVDTGMNVLGWSLERARDYMRAYSGMPETEIRTESIRYSCDYIGQALAYKLGDTQILAMRERMRRALGARFDLKHFHAAILGPGALPMPDLQWHVDHEIERHAKQSQSH